MAFGPVCGGEILEETVEDDVDEGKLSYLKSLTGFSLFTQVYFAFANRNWKENEKEKEEEKEQKE